jgi:hypothetical protein
MIRGDGGLAMSRPHIRPIVTTLAALAAGCAWAASPARAAPAAGPTTPAGPASTGRPLADEARAALRKATAFYAGTVAAHGGYVYKYSADLVKREGEGRTGPDTVWVQPPGTPAVGLALVDAYERTSEPALLAAAKAAGECLVRGQLRSGGWTDRVEFDPIARGKVAYRDDPPAGKKKNAFNVSTFDDDKTQAPIRFLVRLDKALGFKDARVHEAVTVALDSVLKAQFASGAWAQGWDAFPDPAAHPPRKASFPETWSRTYPGGKYWFLATTNDDTLATTVDALLLAAAAYDEPRYRSAAARAGDFVIAAQLPDPQPAWAQQYADDMTPAWARKFEPPAITGHESQGLMRTLLRLYVETGDAKYLKPIPPALAYLKKCQLPDGRMSRFYELRTNRPLYFTKTYELTYDDGDVPMHYGFKQPSRLGAIGREYDRVSKLTPEQLAAERAAVTAAALGGRAVARGAAAGNGAAGKAAAEAAPAVPPALEAEARGVVAALDDRGAWVEDGKLKYHGPNDPTTRIIDSATFARHLGTLARYVEAAMPAAGAGAVPREPSAK